MMLHYVSVMYVFLCTVACSYKGRLNYRTTQLLQLNFLTAVILQYSSSLSMLLLSSLYKLITSYHAQSFLLYNESIKL